MINFLLYAGLGVAILGSVFIFWAACRVSHDSEDAALVRPPITNVGQLPDLSLMILGGYIVVRKHPTAELYIYNYTAKTQYERVWNESTLTCRGLIADADGYIVSRPFTKFFNWDELERLPDEPFEVYEKYDGSLMISYWLDGVPYLASRGSFDSEHAVRGTELLRELLADRPDLLDPALTYLFELIDPAFQIVIDYGGAAWLPLLAVLETATGIERPLYDAAGRRTFPAPLFTAYRMTMLTTFESVSAYTHQGIEGFVLRYQSGLRVKVKQAEYLRLHKLLTGITEKDILEDYLIPGRDLAPLLERVPDEFYTWVEATAAKFRAEYKALEAEATALLLPIRATRREYALAVAHERTKHIFFRMLDGKDYQKQIWQLIKPESNRTYKIEKK